MKVLITGGAGFIGSTVASACLDAGITPVIIDDLSTGRVEFVRDRAFYRGDIADGSLIDRVFSDHPDLGCVVHCAARIVVPESVSRPLEYYETNVAKTIILAQHIVRNGCERLVFSSSAAIYLPEPDLSVNEDSILDPQSPYARTKVMAEWVLRDASRSGPLRTVSLRYFNPIGADPQMRTGLQGAEPTHALGMLIRAHKSGGTFYITGVDWDTRDGSTIRDYIHVWDLARAHVAAINRFDELVADSTGGVWRVFNLGTGVGTTVRELVSAAREVVGESFSVAEAPSRQGDVIGCFTRNDRARVALDWEPKLTMVQAIEHSLEWSLRRDEILAKFSPTPE